MFESLREWCRFPIEVHTRTGNTAGGDPKYAPPIEYRGYRVDEVVAITDKHGENYVSTSRVYFPPEVVITEEDLLSFGTDVSYEIRKIGGFYDGNDGAISILVVYL